MCGAHTFIKGVEVNLPDDVLAALGAENYTVIGEAITPEPKAQKKNADKMIKEAKNK